jgi:hypothetical protein
MPRNTAWEADYAQRLEAKRWEPVLTAAYACVSPAGREREREFVLGFLHSSSAKPFLPHWEKARMRVFQQLLPAHWIARWRTGVYARDMSEKEKTRVRKTSGWGRVIRAEYRIA